VDMTASEKNLAEVRLTRESDARAREERNREGFSRGVSAHTEAIKVIKHLKQRIHSVRISVRDNRTAAEAAQAKSPTSEGSWSQQRQAEEAAKSAQSVSILSLNLSSDCFYHFQPAQRMKIGR